MGENGIEPVTVSQRRRQLLRWVLPALLLIAFFAGGWTLRNKLAADRQGEWLKATRDDLVIGFEVEGTLASLASETLGPPPLPDVWNFKLSMLAPEGSDVKRGQPVAGFDTSDLQRRLDEKRAEADEARSQIEKERADLALQTKGERLKLAEAEARLRKGTLKLEAPAEIQVIHERRTVEIEHDVAQREAKSIRGRLDALERAATARIALLESRLREAEAIVERTQSSIRKMTLTSPSEGTVIYVTNWRGDKKKIGDNVWKQEKIIEIPDLSKMKAEGEVDEVDAGRVALGQRVSLRLDAHPDEEFSGTIRSAGTTVQRKKATQDPLKVLRVEIELDRTDPVKMRPGMRFTGTIETGRVSGAVLIPREAVFVAPSGPFVYRRGRFSTESIPVRLGKEGDRFVQVLNGVNPGERVLVPGRGEKEDA
ncbi:MAG TPA: efflux RND transporter periplasmic adaptor subunit [Thermoanaerobaculia bacterium]